MPRIDPHRPIEALDCDVELHDFRILAPLTMSARTSGYTARKPRGDEHSHAVKFHVQDVNFISRNVPLETARKCHRHSATMSDPGRAVLFHRAQLREALCKETIDQRHNIPMPAVIRIQDGRDDVIARIVEKTGCQDEVLTLVPNPIETANVNLYQSRYVDR